MGEPSEWKGSAWADYGADSFGVSGEVGPSIWLIKRNGPEAHNPCASGRKVSDQ